MMLWNGSIAVLLVACLASFTWAMGHFFTQPAGMTPGMKVIRFCGTLFGLLHLGAILWPAAVTPERACAAAMLYAGALGLFWWAIATHRRAPVSAVFSPDLPQRLVQAGPYQFVRHPFYASYLLMWTAGIIATHQVWLALSVFVMGAIYVVAARSEELKFQTSTLARQYAAYRARTGLFLPNPWKMISTARSQPSHEIY
jgi:protein-S-isoprenylcysteine O-methyltransferase Ste14